MCCLSWGYPCRCGERWPLGLQLGSLSRLSCSSGSNYRGEPEPAEGLWGDPPASPFGFVEGLNGEHLFQPGDLEQAAGHLRWRVNHQFLPFRTQLLLL